MKTAGQIADLTSRIVSLSQSLVNHEYVRSERIASIKAETGRTMDWIAEQLAKVGGLPEIQALHSQVMILRADIEPEIQTWGNPSQVLRLAAMPSGVTSEAAAVQGLLRAEATALEADPAALQAAMIDAANSKDWSRLYALSLGRLDLHGNPLEAYRGKIQGVRFDCLDLPGQESVLESLFRSRVGWMEADLAWSRAKGEAENYTFKHLLTRAAGDYERAKMERRARLRLTPAEALERAELERVEPSSRFVKLDTTPGLYGIFDTLTGDSRFVGEEGGPAYLHRLNHPTASE